MVPERQCFVWAGTSCCTACKMPEVSMVGAMSAGKPRAAGWRSEQVLKVASLSHSAASCAAMQVCL